MAAPLKNEIGNEYGLLTVVSRAGRDSKGKASWNCKCKCGGKAVVSGVTLRAGLTISCGCEKKGNKKSKYVSEKVRKIRTKYWESVLLGEIQYDNKTYTNKPRKS